jgi:hypothetical protein
MNGKYSPSSKVSVPSVHSSPTLSTPVRLSTPVCPRNVHETSGRDVVFCSVVVTTSVITSLRDDELTESAMVTKIILSRSGHSPKSVLLWKQERHVSAVFATALLGLASVRSIPASAASHRQLISACRRDELGVANRNVTSELTGQACPQHSCLSRLPRRAVGLAVERPARAPAESRVRSVRPLD